ncbi:MAG TPA: hypothetical protein VMR81_03605 [Patescibacteria group bacterium]|jgi:hypothetical protein|nr:hypothetical protein [Patescibacteria group bacterium]
MSEDAIEQLSSQLSEIQDPVERNIILELVRTRAAAGFEMQQDERSDIYWKGVGNIIEEMMKRPEEALNSAIDILKLPERSNDPDQFRSWLKGNVLIILSDPRMQSLVTHELNKPGETVIHSSLAEFLSYQIPKTITTKEDLSHHPQCFELVMSMVMVSSLTEQHIPSLSPLAERTGELLQDEMARRVIDLYYDVPGDKQYVEPVYNLIHPEAQSEGDVGV